VDAKGKEVDTLRIRTHLVKDIPFSRSFFIWSTPLYARIRSGRSKPSPDRQNPRRLDFSIFSLFKGLPEGESWISRFRECLDKRLFGCTKDVHACRNFSRMF